jgi:hypothetical protein
VKPSEMQLDRYSPTNRSPNDDADEDLLKQGNIIGKVRYLFLVSFSFFSFLEFLCSYRRKMRLFLLLRNPRMKIHLILQFRRSSLMLLLRNHNNDKELLR